MIKSMKRIMGLTIVSMLFVLLTACGSKSSGSASKDYEFTYQGQTITIHSEAKKFLEAAGTPKDTKKTASCAYDGYDRSYVYDGFTVNTYSKTKQGEEYINSIVLTGDQVATKEKIKLGSTEKDLQKAYGTSKGKFGVYTYTKGKSKLVIEVDDAKEVTTIQYLEK